MDELFVPNKELGFNILMIKNCCNGYILFP
mgnify:CR=1 FL=1